LCVRSRCLESNPQSTKSAAAVPGAQSRNNPMTFAIYNDAASL
jgi:hypothetical protein